MLLGEILSKVNLMSELFSMTLTVYVCVMEAFFWFVIPEKDDIHDINIQFIGNIYVWIIKPSISDYIYDVYLMMGSRVHSTAHVQNHMATL